MNDSGGVWAPERRLLTVGLVLTITLVAFEAMAVATVMPEVADDLEGLSLYGWVFSAFMLGNLVGIVMAGQEADRTGPARPYVIGLAVFAAGLVVGGLAPSMPVLVAGRLLQGLGAGAIPASAYVTIGRGFPERARPRMMAILSSAWVVPALVGPAVSSFIAATVGWRFVFLGLLPLVALAGSMTVASLSRLPAPVGDDGRSRLVDAVRVAAGAGLALASLTPPAPWLAPPFVIAGALLGLPALRRLLPPGTFRLADALAAAVVCRFVINFSFFGAEAFLPLTLNEVRGRSLGFAGVILTLSGLTWTVGSWTQERRGIVWGGRALVRAGMALLAVAVALLLPVVWSIGPAALAFPAWAIAGLGMGLAYPTITIIVLRVAPPGREGASAASLQLADALGVAAGTGLGGAAVATGEAVGWAASSGIALADVMALAVLALGAVAVRRLPVRHMGEDDVAAPAATA